MINRIIYNGNTLEKQATIKIPSDIKEGWGLARRNDLENNEIVQNLYITDGSATVFVTNPKDLSIKRKIEVKDGNGQPVWSLNELEFVKDKLWANIYLTTKIAVIDINTGNVEKFIDLADILQDAVNNFSGYWNREYCLNGIAYHPDSDR